MLNCLCFSSFIIIFYLYNHFTYTAGLLLITSKLVFHLWFRPYGVARAPFIGLRAASPHL